MSELIVMGVSFFVACMGVLGLASPSTMVRFASSWQSRSGLWVASVIRLAFGVALWGVAAGSQFPVSFRVLSAMAVISAVILPVIGVSRLKSLIAWWSRQSQVFIRAWSTVALLMGVFLIWSLVA